MDLCGSNSHLFRNSSSGDLEIPNEEPGLSALDDYNALFINYAATAWHEMRRAWRDNRDTSPASQRNPEEKVKRWIISCPDLLPSREPFDKPVPLSKTVKFLVEAWEQSHRKRHHDPDSSDGSATRASYSQKPPLPGQITLQDRNR